jgi:hypothetical protein
MKPNASAPRRRRSGFALLITITLLAFLVLLLVSLAALTRVETQVASNNQQLSQARQNALMALNIALGRLQSLAGPDQRVTATAEIVAGVHTDKRKWTGVWNTNAITPVPEWLVSTTTPAAATGTAEVTTAFPPSGTVTLVGSNTVDTSTPGNAVNAETQPIIATGIPGLDPSTAATVGRFAYWVGDEGVKAKVSLADPWETPSELTLDATTPATTLTQAKAYHFINAQRVGIEGVGADAADSSKLAGAYPATNATFKELLPKVLSLSQLAMANPAGQAALTSTQKVRFHDLTATSYGVLADVARGGLKKDLTAWIADTSATTPHPSTPAAASDDYIAPGDPLDTAKYGLPKWELIRSYATMHATGSALAPQAQTPSKHGLSPVITYARVGYNISLPPDGAGTYHINVMPVVALWNPYNVPLQKSTNDSNTYEFCFKYKPTTFGGSGGAHIADGARLKLVVYSSTDSKTDAFYLGTIQIQGTVPGPLGPAGTFASYAVGSSPQLSTRSGPAPVFWRFKVSLSKDLAPGESRLFTVSDASDDSQYVAGKSELSDAALGVNNGVYLPSTTPFSPAQRLPSVRFFWNTEPIIGGNDFSIRPDSVMTEFRLTKPVQSGETNLSTIDAFLSSPDNTYQAILGHAFDWRADTNPYFLFGQIPPNNTGRSLVYQRIELLMSTNYDKFVSGFTRQDGKPHIGAGTPRWLAELNPQATVALRKPQAATSSNTPSPAAVLMPSYESQRYIDATQVNSVDFPYIDIPETDGTKVSAGTQVATTGNAQNVVLREFQSASTPLFSLGQLQHVNASLLNVNPAYPIGNSLANLYVPRTATQSEVLPQDAFNTFSSNNTFPGFPSSSTFRHIYDLSYLLNKALWDSCFFSTIPAGLTSAAQLTAHYRLPNARHEFHWRTSANAEFNELKTTEGAAAHLLVNGGFNINSTSEQAWRALLYSHNGIAIDPNDATKKHPFSRLAAPVDPSHPNTTWPGYRILSDAQIDALSKAIVAEVRKRGPFLSLADFVNRRLVGDETGLKGPLQAAIDATTINGGSPFDFATMPVKVYSTEISADSEQQLIYKGDTSTALPSTTPASSRATFAPGYLSQADLLAALGPSLTARSDTFRIRAYGEVLNPVTPDAEPTSRAWCEAIAQRLPDYIEPDVDPSTTPASGSASATFGRRFKIISFRWLSPNDI